MEDIKNRRVVFFDRFYNFQVILTLKRPLRRAPRHLLSLKLKENTLKVVTENFWLHKGGFVKDIMNKRVVIFDRWKNFLVFLALKRPFNRGPRHPLPIKLKDDNLELLY